MNAPGASLSPKEILRERARRFAAEPTRADADGPAVDVIEFALAHERYALETRYIAEVQPLDQLAELPCTPDFYSGIINVRGRIVPVIDIKKFFGLAEKGITDLHRVIIARHQEVELGVLADYVVATRQLSLAALQPGLPTLTGIRADYLKGITDELLIVLDAAKMLTDPRLTVDETPQG